MAGPPLKPETSCPITYAARRFEAAHRKYVDIEKAMDDEMAAVRKKHEIPRDHAQNNLSVRREEFIGAVQPEIPNKIKDNKQYPFKVLIDGHAYNIVEGPFTAYLINIEKDIKTPVLGNP